MLQDEFIFLSTSPSIQPCLLELSNLLSDVWKPYVNNLIIYKYKKKHELIRVSELSEKVYYIKKGLIQYKSIGVNGLQKTTLVIGQGCLCGEELLFHKQPALFTAEALTNIEVFAFPKEEFVDIINVDVNISVFVIKYLAIKCRIFASQIEDLSFRTTIEKICRVLYCYFLNNQYSSEMNNTIKISQQELANTIGSHRVSIAKGLNELKEQNIIDYGSGVIYIKEKYKLREKGFGY